MSIFRITFSPNGLKPFVWQGLEGIKTYERATQLFNLLCNFDLGRVSQSEIDFIHGSAMINSYKAYRRKHGINHSDMIDFSDGTIDQLDDNGDWWIVSESADEIPDYEVGEMSSF